MNKLREAAELALEALIESESHTGSTEKWRRHLAAKEALRQALAECNPHPDAPHGFDRGASHSADRYVCECESWSNVDPIDTASKRVDETKKRERIIVTDRQRLEAIVAVVCRYLPPDGISRAEAMNEIIGLVDPLPAQTEQEPYAHKANLLNSDRMQINPVTGDVSIGTPSKQVAMKQGWDVDTLLAQPERGFDRTEALIEEYGVDGTAKREQEPVAWINADCLRLDHIIKAPIQVCRRQEDEHYNVPLYTAPPIKPWVSLTDEKIFDINHKAATDYEDGLTYARAIEAASKEKNRV